MTLSVTINGHAYNTDDYNAGSNAYGLGAGGWRLLVTTFVYDILADAGIALQMTASDSLTIGTGAKVFTPTTLRGVPVGAPVFALHDANNWMWGTVTALSATQVTITVTATAGAGTFASWTLQPSGPQGPVATFATNAQAKTGTSTTTALTPDDVSSVIWARFGKRTDINTNTALVSFTRYRATAANTHSLPTMAANEYVIVERDTTAGSVFVTRNSQTIDGVAADFEMDVNKQVMLFFCDSAGVVVTRLIGVVPT